MSKKVLKFTKEHKERISLSNTKYKNLIGEKFGYLTILEYKQKGNNLNNRKWLAQCKCGNTKIVREAFIKNEKGISCGCYRKEAHTRHGMTKTNFHQVWKKMRQRCKNPNDKQFKDYGGRGIKVYKRWEIFENFRDDMYTKYLEHKKEFGRNTSIDRIDVNGNYCKENCRWATWVEQANNKRKYENKS